MDYTVFELLSYFIIYSMAGWLMESIVRSISERKIINTGFLNGPMCPIYGIGAIIMLLFLSNFKDNIFLLFILGFLVLSIWEYIVGVLLEKMFQTKYWDYSDQKWNIQGRVCLINSLCWGILGIIFIYFIHPFVQAQVMKINPMAFQVIMYLITLIFVIDLINSIIKTKNIKSSLQKIEMLNQQIKQKLEEIKEVAKDKTKEDLQENLKLGINQLTIRKNRIIKKLYRRVFRLKKAFPTINTKEFTEILNKKIEFIKKETKEKVKKRNKEG